MIKAIIFDCFGVLTTDTWRAFVDSLPLGVDIERARGLNRQYDAGLISKEEFLQQVFDTTGHHPKQIEEMLDSEITKNAPLLDYIRELKKNYKIGLLSNVATPWITDSFLTPEEIQLFDEMIFSFEVGITKPDPRIFQLAADKLGVSLKECVLVDDIERYCEAARATGMTAVTYQDLRQLKNDLATIL